MPTRRCGDYLWLSKPLQTAGHFVLNWGRGQCQSDTTTRGPSQSNLSDLHLAAAVDSTGPAQLITINSSPDHSCLRLIHSDSRPSSATSPSMIP